MQLVKKTDSVHEKLHFIEKKISYFIILKHFYKNLVNWFLNTPNIYVPRFVKESFKNVVTSCSRKTSISGMNNISICKLYNIYLNIILDNFLTVNAYLKISGMTLLGFPITGIRIQKVYTCIRILYIFWHNGIGWIGTLSRFHTGNVTSVPLMICYFATILITYILPRFFGVLPYRSVSLGFKNGLNT